MDFSLLLTLLLALAFIVTLLSFLRRDKPCRNLPPGPAPLPVVGNLLQLGDKPHRCLAELAKNYGPVMSLKLGRVTTVVVSSSKAAEEVLQKHDLAASNRLVPDVVRIHDNHHYSVVWLPLCARWRALRKILNSNIFSGKRIDASQVLREEKLNELVSYAGICCERGVAMDVGRAAFITMLNILSRTLFSVDLADLNEDGAQEFKDLVWSIMKESGKLNVADYIPMIGKFDLQGIRRRMTVNVGKILHLFHRLIDERLKLRSQHKNHAENDVIDVLLHISEENSEEIDRTQIERLCWDLFVAGTETSSSTVEWAMAELLLNPETLWKAKAELEQTIGRTQLVKESDLAHLPYLRAIVNETLRLHPAVPFVHRKVDRDVEVSGYTVPEGAQVLVNAWAIGRDPETWHEPTRFMPERFLGLEIDVRGRNFELIPFGSGRRICPGMPLALKMVPVMLGSLVNSFEWKLPEEIGGEMDMKEKFGITLQKAQSLLLVPINM